MITAPPSKKDRGSLRMSCEPEQERIYIWQDMEKSRNKRGGKRLSGAKRRAIRKARKAAKNGN